MSSTVAVFGLGIIGSRSADCIAQKGHLVRTWNRSPMDRPDIAASAADAARGADFITFYLKDGQAVREVFTSIRDTLVPGQTVLNHSTIDLETTHWLADQCEQLGCPFLDAPFTGSKVAAGNGALVYYVGGDPAILDQARDLLSATSKEIQYIGPVGSATVVKIATNLISAATVQALAEALAIATRHGIDPDAFSRCVSSNACGSLLASMKLPAMAAGDFDAHFSLDNMLKDSRFALQLAQQSGLNTPVTEATSKAMEDGCKKGDASLDFCAVYKAYRGQ